MGNPTKLWQPPGQAQQFRAERSFNRDTKRLCETYRTLRKEMSAQASFSANDRSASTVIRFRPEDIGGESGDLAHPDDTTLNRIGRTHGSRSHYGHDCYGHASKREAARSAIGLHAAAHRTHSDGHPMKDNLELSPGSVYNLKFRKFGEEHVRRHVSASEAHATMSGKPDLRQRTAYRSLKG